MSLSAPPTGIKKLSLQYFLFMILILEIFFAACMLHALFEVAVGLAQMLGALMAQLASWILIALSKAIEIMCSLWQTAFFGDEA